MSSAGKLAIKFEIYRRVFEYACNVTLALFYLIFDYRLLVDFIQYHRISSLLLVIFETTIVCFSFFRKTPKESNYSPYDWFIALAGTLIIALLRPNVEMKDNSLLLTIQMVGILISLAGLFSLNRSWGLVPVNRGIKSSGFYRLVRHPIYAGYFLSVFFYVAQNITPSNIMILMLFLILEVLRIHAEEDILSRDPAYLAYKRKTKWRVIPFVY